MRYFKEKRCFSAVSTVELNFWPMMTQKHLMMTDDDIMMTDDDL